MRGGPPQPGLPLVLPVGRDGDVPDHSTFSKNRHGRFRDSDLLRSCSTRCCGAAWPRVFSTPRTQAPPDDTLRYRASKADCQACALKPRCCPNTPMRKVTRSIHEDARDFARDIAKTDAYVVSRRERKKVPMRRLVINADDCEAGPMARVG